MKIHDHVWFARYDCKKEIIFYTRGIIESISSYGIYLIRKTNNTSKNTFTRIKSEIVLDINPISASVSP